MGISTDKGLFLSDDYGNRFNLISKPIQVTAVEFEEDSILYFGFGDGQTALYKQNLTNHSESKVSTPSQINEKNPILFIASNHKNRDEITVVDYNNSIYQSKDQGTSWKTLLKSGQK